MIKIHGVLLTFSPEEGRTTPIEYKIDYIRLYQDETGVLYDVDEERRIHERK